MRRVTGAIAAGLIASAAPALAQGAAPPPPAVEQRVATLSAGFGNAHGWNGVQAQCHVLEGRASAFVGGGFTPRTRDSERRFAAAVGARLFSRGQRHRLFVEMSVSQIGRELASYLHPAGRQIYGPGTQLGYELRVQNGVTLVLSGGAGYGLGISDYNNPWRPMVGASLGYTWSSR